MKLGSLPHSRAGKGPVGVTGKRHEAERPLRVGHSRSPRGEESFSERDLAGMC